MLKIPCLLLLVLVITIPQHGVATLPGSSRKSTSLRYSRFAPIDISNHVIRNVLILRGGLGIDEDGYDDYDDETEDDEIDHAELDEATAMHQKRSNQRRQAPSKPPPRPQVDARGRHKAPYIPKKKKKKSLLSKMASTSLSLSKKAAVTTAATTGKAAYYLMKPKSIQRQELWGVWRLDQQVGVRQATANIELTPRGMVIIRDGSSIIWKAPYKFFEPTWPQSCRVEFEARAFMPSGGKKSKPWLLFYKGYLERKMADSKVIKMVGKLYEIEHPKSMFGKDLPVKYNKIGTFVGRKRVVIEDDDEEEYDEYDDEEEEEEEEERYRGRGRRTRPEEDESEEEYDEYDEEL